MTLEEAFKTGHLELLSRYEEITLAEFLRWLRARADQFEQVAPGDDPLMDYQTYKADVDDWIDSLLG
jgi:hypothetical protein